MAHVSSKLKTAFVVLLGLVSWLATAAVSPAAKVPKKSGETIVVAAAPNSGQDATAAVLEAIKTCRDTGARRIVFNPGRYDFHAGTTPFNKNVLFPILKMDGLVVDGQGAELQFHDPMSVFSVASSKNVTLKNLTIDWPRPPFSSGEILASGPKWFDVKVFDEFPVKGGEPVGAWMEFDPKTQLPHANNNDSYEAVASTELIAPQTLRVHLKWPFKVQPGLLMLLRHQVYEHPAIQAFKSKDLRVENVTIYSCPGMSFVAGQSENVTLDRFRVMLKPGTRQLMSATADGSHFYGCTGTVCIKDCLFEGMGDDAVNIKTGMYLTVHERVDDYTILGANNLPRFADMPDAGDTMEFHHADDLISYDARQVKAVKVLPHEPPKTTGLPDIRTEKRIMARVSFTKPLPEDLKTSDVLGNATRLCKVEMTGTTVRRNRGRGILIQTRDARVEDCTFDSCTASGIMIISEIRYFFESISARDVVVKNCRFINNNFAPLRSEGAIEVVGYLAGFKMVPNPGVFRDIELRGNTIDGTNGCGIFVTGTDNIKIIDNKITNACRAPLNANTHSAAIQLISTRNAIVKGNQVPAANQGPGFRTAFETGEGSEKETIKLRANKGF